MKKSNSIALTLENEILNNMHITGSMLPSVNSLSKRFSVHRNTVNQAMKILAQKDLIQTKNGIGSIIKQRVRNINQEIEKNKTETYCIIADLHKNIYQATMLEIFQQYLFSQNAFSYIIYLDTIRNNFRFVINTLKEKNVTGVFISCGNIEKIALLLHMLKENDMAFTTITCFPGYEKHHCGFSEKGDNRTSEKQVEYLASLGHQKIGFIAGTHHDTAVYKRRLEGYLHAVERYAGISEAENLVAIGDFFKSEWIRQAFNLYYEKKITALICFDDTEALQAINIFPLRNILIPENLSIMGFGGYYNDTEIPITTLSVPYEYKSARYLSFMHSLLKGIEYKEEFPAQTNTIKEGVTCKKIISS
ncbi:MAG: hypothetical protein A2096_01715 [Spirochaetes bacterium GWF1_41_5]|nr:MAG: hypothetical protein A2096_01715 [Spirochaetes bacterium GWF1_41_5]HBE00900.1 hypothetical protein [Spirochaetia bacterium]